MTGNQDRAAETLELWKAAYPRDSRPPNALALIYNRIGRYDRAIAEAQEALQRSPGHPFPLSNLAFAYRALGRYAEARTTAQEAVKLGVETTPTRRLLYQIGLMTGRWHGGRAPDLGRRASHASSISSPPRRRRRRSTAACRRRTISISGATDMAVARGLSGTASGYAAHLALTEALYRGPREPPAHIRATIGRIEAEAEAPGTVPRFRAGVGVRRSPA